MLSILQSLPPPFTFPPRERTLTRIPAFGAQTVAESRDERRVRRMTEGERGKGGRKKRACVRPTKGIVTFARGRVSSRLELALIFDLGAKACLRTFRVLPPPAAAPPIFFPSLPTIPANRPSRVDRTPSPHPSSPLFHYDSDKSVS